MDELKDKITDGIKTAMKAKDKVRTSVLRMILAEIKNAEKSGKEFITIDVIKGYSKKLKKSIEEYAKLDSVENVESLRKEVSIVEEFLPAQMSNEELTKIVVGILKANNITSMKEMGKAMKLVMAEHGDAVDGNSVQNIVKENLS